MKPVELSKQNREDVLSIINDLKLTILASDFGKFDLVPTALENGFVKYQEIIEQCIDKEDENAKGQ